MPTHKAVTADGIARRKTYWNPYADLGHGSYEKVYAEAQGFVGKQVEVVRDDDMRVQGILRDTKTCADGSLGLVIATSYCDRWVSPDFKSIRILA
jgi:hypothetical protein